MLDIATIPLTPEQYQIDLPKLTDLELKQISTPQTLDSDQQEFMELHYKLSHLPLPAMIVLAEKGRIKKKFAKLKHRLPVCMSCIFGTAHCKPWRSKVSKGSIRKESDNAPGKCVSMDQLVSAQPGLIPQMAGFLLICKSGGRQYLLITAWITFTWHSCETLDSTRLYLLSRLSSIMQMKVGFLLLPIKLTMVVLQMLDFRKQ